MNGERVRKLGFLCALAVAAGPDARADVAAEVAAPGAEFEQAADAGVAKPGERAGAQSTGPSESQKPVLFILPNFRGADASAPFAPISAKEKLTMARKDSLYYPIFFVAGAFAGLYQMQNQTPSYGQGLAGYGKRYGSALGDQLIANYLSEGVFPAALHQDPRYFRLGPAGGGFWKRTGYALSRVLVTRNDKGAWTFNSSEWAGVTAATVFSNVYYPEDSRTAAKNLQKLGMQVGGDAFYNLLREFWPELQQKLTR